MEQAALRFEGNSNYCADSYSQTNAIKDVSQSHKLRADVAAVSTKGEERTKCEKGPHWGRLWGGAHLPFGHYPCPEPEPTGP